MSDERVGITRGRYQPFGHHHAGYILEFIDRLDLDTVYPIIQGVTTDHRGPHNPLTGEEIREGMEESFEELYDTRETDVQPLLQETISATAVMDEIEADTVTFFTCEPHWDRLVSGLVGPAVEQLYDIEVETAYFPREDGIAADRMRAEGYDVADSATEIRQLIAAEQQDRAAEDWRQYIPDPMADRIAEGDGYDAVEPASDQSPLEQYTIDDELRSYWDRWRED